MDDDGIKLAWSRKLTKQTILNNDKQIKYI